MVKVEVMDLETTVQFIKAKKAVKNDGHFFGWWMGILVRVPVIGSSRGNSWRLTDKPSKDVVGGVVTELLLYLVEGKSFALLLTRGLMNVGQLDILRRQNLVKM